jgi:hypothetical protein
MSRRSAWYGCNLTRSHSSALSGASFCQREHVGCLVGEQSGYGRIEGVTCALANHLRCELVPAEHALEGSVSGDVDDAHRQRDLVVLRAARLTLTIPAFGRHA